MRKLRKQRRLEAKLNGTKFEPQYNGNSPVSYEEYSGVGNERYNNRFVQFDETEMEVFSQLENEASEIERETEESAKKTSRFMARVKKMFGKK